MVNIGIVLVFAAFYLRFAKEPEVIPRASLGSSHTFELREVRAGPPADRATSIGLSPDSLIASRMVLAFIKRGRPCFWPISSASIALLTARGVATKQHWAA